MLISMKTIGRVVEDMMVVDDQQACGDINFGLLCIHYDVFVTALFNGDNGLDCAS